MDGRQERALRCCCSQRKSFARRNAPEDASCYNIIAIAELFGRL